MLLQTQRLKDLITSQTQVQNPLVFSGLNTKSKPTAMEEDKKVFIDVVSFYSCLHKLYF